MYEPSDFELDKPYDMLQEIAENLGFEFVNPVSQFRERLQAGDKLFLEGDSHFNEAGHALFARIIAEYLMARGNQSGLKRGTARFSSRTDSI